jgi:cobalt-zinc-cadmium efflux system membrane fusion protein
MKNSIIIILFSLLFSACSSGNKKEEVTSEEQISAVIQISASQFKANNMTFATPKLVGFNEVLTTTGYIDVPPEFKASISTFYPGYVKKITLIEGNYVKKGQLLFQLENPEYLQMQIEYLEAREKLEYLKSEYERQKALAEEQIAAQKNFLKAKSEYFVTKTMCDGSAKKLGLLGLNAGSLTSENIRSSINIYSPISGYVSSINVTQGKVLNPDEVAMTITNTEHLHAELQLFEKDITGIKIGQKITYTIGNEKINGEVHLISKSVSDEKRTISVHGHLDNGEHLTKLYPGMYVEATIAKTTATKFGVPEAAVVDLEDKYYVLIKTTENEGVYNFKKVELTKPIFGNGFVSAQEIMEGITVLASGAFDVLVE